MSYLTLLLLKYKYAIIFPLAFFEGHIVSLVAGFLARMDLLNPFLAGVCIIAGNLLGDVCLYWLGYHKGEKWVRRFGNYFGIDEEKLEKGRAIYHTHKNSILFFSKLTNGFGLAMAILFTAGVVRIKFSTYMFWNFIGECIWTGGLISVGYFLGSIYTVVDSVILKVGLIVGVALVLVALFLFMKNRIKAKINI